MRQQSAIIHGSIDPCIIVRIIERTMQFFGIKPCAVQKTKKEIQAEKGQVIICWAKFALKKRNLEDAERACKALETAIEQGGYGDVVWLKREHRKIRNGIDCVSAIKK